MRASILVIFVTLILTDSAFGTKTSAPVTGNELLSLCSGWSGGQIAPAADAYDSDECLGFIQGLTDSTQAMRYADRPSCIFAMPEGGTYGQVIDIVMNYLRAHPESRQRSAANLAIAALKAVWPCK